MRSVSLTLLAAVLFVVIASALAVFLPGCGDSREPSPEDTDIASLTLCLNDGMCSPQESNSCFDCQCTVTTSCNCNGHCDANETHVGCHRDCPPACPYETMDQCTPRTYPLRSYCSPDVAAVCAHDAHCCVTRWDLACVQEIWSVAHSSVCGGVEANLSGCTTPPSSCPGGTTDSFWNIGAPKIAASGGETTRLCNLDGYCCQYSWDEICQSEWILPIEDGSPAQLHHTCGNHLCADPIQTNFGAYTNIETPNNCAYDCAR